MASSFDLPNVLVTGGAGFLGSHLCESLLDRAHVICVDDYSTGSEANIHHLLAHPNFEFIRHDITEPLRFEDIKESERFRLAFVGVQQIYHLASPASPRQYLAHPVASQATTEIGTKNILDLAVRYHARVVLGSDMRVYGDIADRTKGITEDYVGHSDFSQKLNWYVESKRAAENLVHAYRQEYSIDATIVRLFGAYGPHMSPDDGRMIPTLIEQALAGQALRIPQEISRIAPCYITDVVNVLEKAMQYEGFQIFNGGTSTTYTLEEVAARIIALSDSSSPVVVAPEGDEVMAAWVSHEAVADIARARDELGWFPVVLLDEGLTKTIDDMKSQRAMGALRRS